MSQFRCHPASEEDGGEEQKVMWSQPRPGERREGRGPGWLFPCPVRPYLPCNQVLEMAQLVLVLWVLPAILFGEEGLGWGVGDRWGFRIFYQVGHMVSGIERKLDVREASRTRALGWTLP